MNLIGNSRLESPKKIVNIAISNRQSEFENISMHNKKYIYINRYIGLIIYKSNKLGAEIIAFFIAQLPLPMVLQIIRQTY
jgi:hypothetical protein